MTTKPAAPTKTDLSIIDIERKVTSLLMRSRNARAAFSMQYPEFKLNPTYLFSNETYGMIATTALGFGDNLTGTILAGMHPELINTPYDPTRLYEAANRAEERNVLLLCEQLANNQQRRKGLNILAEAQAEIKKAELEAVPTVIKDTVSRLGEITVISEQTGELDSDKQVDNLLEKIAAGGFGLVSTGYAELDEILGNGIHRNPGELVVVGGPPKQGKSRFVRSLVSTLQINYGDINAVWISNEPSFGVGPIKIDEIAQEATRWYRKNRREGDPYSPFDHNMARDALGKLENGKVSFFSMPILNRAIEEGIAAVRSWQGRRRTFSAGLREGNSLNIDYIAERARQEIEFNGANLIVVDHLQGWIQWLKEQKGMKEFEAVSYSVGKWSRLQSQYPQIIVICISQYNADGGLLFGSTAKQNLSFQLEVNIHEENNQQVENRMDVKVIDGRWVTRSATSLEVDPSSGLIIGGYNASQQQPHSRR